MPKAGYIWFSGGTPCGLLKTTNTSGLLSAMTRLAREHFLGKVRKLFQIVHEVDGQPIQPDAAQPSDLLSHPIGIADRAVGSPCQDPPLQRPFPNVAEQLLDVDPGLSVARLELG